ncbi:MAG: sigma-70 family RNA polymerase sigma factor [Planctomycetales bacterium]|nr:sigma-70 family RNA polymerase sigma factor [Planctomycetales bacterium]
MTAVTMESALCVSTHRQRRRFATAVHSARTSRTSYCMHDEQVLNELIQRAAAGDERAATDLVREYEPELRRFVRYRLTQPRIRALIDSIDVTQSVFASFFIALAEGRLEIAGPGQLVKLLTTMATNKLHDHHRRTTAKKRASQRAADALRIPEENVPSTDHGPSDLMAQNDFVDVFRSRLSREERDLLDWRMEGRSWDEIALKTESSAEAIRKRFSRAVDRAAAELGLTKAS